MQIMGTARSDGLIKTPYHGHSQNYFVSLFSFLESTIRLDSPSSPRREKKGDLWHDFPKKASSFAW